MTITSKRHIVKFYLFVIIFTILFGAIATICLFEYIDLAENGKLKAINNLLLILSFVCYAFAGYTWYRFNKNAPKIILNKVLISFNKRTYLLADIKELTLTGKQPFKFEFNVPMEAARLTFNNNLTEYIFDDMYSNSGEIKSFLKQIVFDKKEYVEVSVSAIDKDAVANDVYDSFKGNQLTSFTGIALWSLIIFFVYMILDSKRIYLDRLFYVFCLSAFWFIGFSYQMDYFKVSDNYFLVRNHNLFWKRKIYNLSDIKEIIFESPGKAPNSLRIITKDFRNKLYLAGTLSDKTWLALKEKLEAHKIKIRNECIVEKT